MGTPSYPRVCVGTKRGRNYGVVYAPDGRVIGRVFRDGKVARAALGGGRRSFWTAHASLDGVETSASLGTRHERRRDAVAAILAFHEAYPAEAIYAAASRANALDFTTWNIYGGRPLTMAERAERALHRALSAAAAQFKYDRWQVCGLSQRNVRNPRGERGHILVSQEV